MDRIEIQTRTFQWIIFGYFIWLLIALIYRAESFENNFLFFLVFLAAKPNQLMILDVKSIPITSWRCYLLLRIAISLRRRLFAIKIS